MSKYYKNDKEFEQDKAIEEMTDYLFGNAISHDTQFKGDYRSIAIDLICAGYRKIPENAVVLTRDEYERLLKEETLCERLGNDVDVKLKYIYELEYKVAQERKETAEKFAEMLKDFFKEKGKIFHDGKQIFHDLRVVSLEKIDEICKEITEGK